MSSRFRNRSSCFLHRDDPSQVQKKSLSHPVFLQTGMVWWYRTAASPGPPTAHRFSTRSMWWLRSGPWWPWLDPLAQESPRCWRPCWEKWREEEVLFPSRWFEEDLCVSYNSWKGQCEQCCHHVFRFSDGRQCPFTNPPYPKLACKVWWPAYQNFDTLFTF